MRIQIILFFLLSSILGLHSQNLLNTSFWRVGSGSVNGFSQNGSSSENSREYGIGPYKNQVLLWKAKPDRASNADGGWNTNYSRINSKKTYRFMVWIKKTHSTNGRTFFGFYSPNNGLTLRGKVNNNPYFWHGDLPKLDRWYLLVGYVHGSSYNSLKNYGSIYDGVTGKKVRSITDFKFKSTATILSHRAYLYYDTNTSDRQYFYAPRMEMVTGKEPSVEDILKIHGDGNTNMLNTSTWKVGKGSVGGFSQNGSTSENSRVYGKNHIGDKVVLWKATPDKAVNADGGWNSSYHKINHRKTYRFSVWIKKTNSHNGTTYFGCGGNILNLSGTTNGNPYFWNGDLPKLNRWYLIVGFVHGSGYKSKSSIGAIYDGVTGKKVKTTTDFKFKSGATITRHRSYLYYDNNTLNSQYFWEPRLEQVTGREPSVNDLLKIRKDSKLLISYDVANNQTQRFYCSDSKYCSLPAARKANEEEAPIAEDYQQAQDSLQEVPSVEKKLMSNDEFKDSYASEEDVYDVQVYPNPTSDVATVDISKIKDVVHSIRLYSSNSSLLQDIKFKESEVLEIDLTGKSVGVYFLHIHLTKGKSITKQIIKK